MSTALGVAGKAAKEARRVARYAASPERRAARAAQNLLWRLGQTPEQKAARAVIVKAQAAARRVAWTPEQKAAERLQADTRLAARTPEKRAADRVKDAAQHVVRHAAWTPEHKAARAATNAAWRDRQTPEQRAVRAAKVIVYRARRTPEKKAAENAQAARYAARPERKAVRAAQAVAYRARRVRHPRPMIEDAAAKAIDWTRDRWDIRQARNPTPFDWNINPGELPTHLSIRTGRDPKVFQMGQKVAKEYGRCQVIACEFEAAGCTELEGAHIVSWTDGGETVPHNFLALCSVHHAIFEDGIGLDLASLWIKPWHHPERYVGGCLRAQNPHHEVEIRTA